MKLVFRIAEFEEWVSALILVYQSSQNSRKKEISMKSKALISCILLPIFFLLLLSTAVQATEYREVKAEDILKQIENGEDVYLENCRIIGELNLSQIELETVSNPKYTELLEIGYNKSQLKCYGYKEMSKVVEINITIRNSIIEHDIEFSNTIFKKPLLLSEVNCSSAAIFISTYFIDSADFRSTYFDDYVDF